MRVSRVLRAIVLSVGLAAALAVGPGHGVAEAATQCSGSQIDSRVVGNIARWRLYWDNSTGRNCVRLDAYGAGVGKTVFMTVEITACDTKNGPCGQTVSNSGPFQTYAGPVSVYARHKCVVIGYYSRLRDGTTVDSGIGPFHCA
jgi:hypothetical protein